MLYNHPLDNEEIDLLLAHQNQKLTAITQQLQTLHELKKDVEDRISTLLNLKGGQESEISAENEVPETEEGHHVEHEHSVLDETKLHETEEAAHSEDEVVAEENSHEAVHEEIQEVIAGEHHPHDHHSDDFSHNGDTWHHHDN